MKFYLSYFNFGFKLIFISVYTVCGFYNNVMRLCIYNIHRNKNTEVSSLVC